MNHPNLFQFATSELSQDAFLCWLIAHAGCDARPALQKVAREFIRWLWTAAHPNNAAPPKSIQLVRGPDRQVDHIDVLFVAELDGVLHTFVIEDKTHSSHHSDQLQRYRAAVEGKGAAEAC